ncbi:STAS domain-containing protein [Stackebrandtia nassauensis]|uniref:STAS domain-containing protein n=1 Tax=Stackebrandtia nassauensis TaxID=283811 RepID=UPI0001A39C33|nr:STAS domain-containing protein [Stackebrandtia nassauensis]
MPGAKAQWRFDEDVGVDDLAALLDEFTEFLIEHRPEVVVCDVRTVERPSKSTLDALAKLSLTAKRHGAQLILSGIGPRLLMLLRVTGMEAVLT